MTSLGIWDILTVSGYLNNFFFILNTQMLQIKTLVVKSFKKKIGGGVKDDYIIYTI